MRYIEKLFYFSIPYVQCFTIKLLTNQNPILIRFFFFFVFVLCSLSFHLNIKFTDGRKSTDPKYEKEFIKEQIQKKYVMPTTGNQIIQEDTLDNANKILPFTSSYG